MLIKQPKNMRVGTHDGYLELKWGSGFGAASGRRLQKAQDYIDNTCIRLMKPYMPFRNGFLEKSSTLGTVIGSGEIRQVAPGARYLYYGEVYGPSFPITGENGDIIGWRSPKGKKKHPTGRALKYDTSRHPQAGPFWFKRMVADHKDDILQGAAKIAGGGKAE